MKELDELIFEILSAQTVFLKSYKELISELDDDELKEAFSENFRHLAVNHKEIIYHLKERLEGFEPDADSEDDEDEEE